MDPTTMSKDQANFAGINANADRCVNHIFSFITSMSLKCAIQLGIADAIHSHGKPMTLSDLSAALGIHPRKAEFLPRLMRILVHLGYFSCDDNPRREYSLTTSSQLLLKDNPMNIQAHTLLVLDPLLVKAWLNLGHWFHNGEDLNAFQAANGKSIWECAADRPDFNRILSDTMASDSRMVASVLMSSHLGRKIFQGLSSLVDVGGGVGEMAKAIAKEFSHVKCMVLDLPHVIKGLQGAHNLSYISGDMFEGIPPANAVMLKWILHDWNDESAVKILKQCKRAITGNGSGEGKGKVIVIDAVMDENESDEADFKKRETQLFFDMEMTTLVGGKERTTKEWEQLFSDAGFRGGFKIFPLLGFRSVIEVYP